MCEVHLQDGMIVYINFFLKEVKYLIDCAVAGNAGCRLMWADKALTQPVMVNLTAVTYFFELEDEAPENPVMP